MSINFSERQGDKYFCLRGIFWALVPTDLVGVCCGSSQLAHQIVLKSMLGLKPPHREGRCTFPSRLEKEPQAVGSKLLLRGLISHMVSVKSISSFWQKLSKQCSINNINQSSWIQWRHFLHCLNRVFPTFCLVFTLPSK